MAKAKAVKLSGTLQIGQGEPHDLFLGTAIARNGAMQSLDLLFSADDRHVFVNMTRESALALCRRIEDELLEVG
jgi:hypothetical protein